MICAARQLLQRQPLQKNAHSHPHARNGPGIAHVCQLASVSVFVQRRLPVITLIYLVLLFRNPLGLRPSFELLVTDVLLACIGPYPAHSSPASLRHMLTSWLVVKQ